jgi:hypothetical protein
MGAEVPRMGVLHHGNPKRTGAVAEARGAHLSRSAAEPQWRGRPETLRALQGYRAANCVSIYLPVSSRAAGIGKLKESLREAYRVLLTRPRVRGEAEAILTTAWTLHEAELLWSEPEAGLALFLSIDRMLAYRLPRRPPQEVWVDRRFHLASYRRCLSGYPVSTPPAAQVAQAAQGPMPVGIAAPERETVP